MAGNDVAYLVRRFYDRLWNAWDDSAVDQTLAAEFTFRGSLGQSTCGRDEWRAYRDGIRLGRPTSTTRSSTSSLTVTGPPVVFTGWHNHSARLTIAICPDNPLLLFDELLAAGHAWDPTGQVRLQLSHTSPGSTTAALTAGPRQRSRHPASP